MTKTRILNVGCGNETYGTDFVDLYPSRKEVRKCNLDTDKLPFRNNTFDIVYSKNLFEHLRNPDNAIKEMSRVLKHGCMLILITDNAAYWLWHNAKSSAKVHDGGYESRGEEDLHYGLFVPYHVENHFIKANIKPIGIEYMTLYANGTVRMQKVRQIAEWIIRRTRFKHMSYAKFRIEGVKA